MGGIDFEDERIHQDMAHGGRIKIGAFRRGPVLAKRIPIGKELVRAGLSHFDTRGCPDQSKRAPVREPARKEAPAGP